MATTYATTPLVSIRQGKLRGALVGRVHAFKGIPYAAPPFGANHLRAPQPAESWTGVRDALIDGAKPPQPPFPGTENAPAPWDRAPIGEDCLNLNIWTPDPGALGLPVMIWITGGSFRAGVGVRDQRLGRSRELLVPLECEVPSPAELIRPIKDVDRNLEA